MSKQSIKLIFYSIIAVALIGFFFKNGFAQTSNPEVAQAVKEGAFLVDVRTPAEFADGSAKGAVNIPLGEVPNRLKEFNGKKKIVVFCRSGNRSGQAKNILEQNGFKNVINGGTWEKVNELVNHK